VSSRKGQGTTFSVELQLWDGAGTVESGDGKDGSRSN